MPVPRPMCGRLRGGIVVAMTETTALPPNGSAQSGTPATPLFVRPREGRMLAGVCAGVADRWGLDITLVRISAVVLSLFSGVGIVVYVAAWLLTPSVDHPAPLAADSDLAARFRDRRVLRRLLTIALVVIAAGILFSAVHTPWFGVPIGLLVGLAVLAVLFGTRLGRWAVGLAVALVVAALATVGIAGPHFGSRTIHVASIDDLQSSYDYGAGSVKLDLSAMPPVSGAHRTDVHLGRGNVTVILPAGVPVLVHARAGVGSVKVDGHRVSGIDAEQTVPIGAGTATAADRLVIDVTVGAGNITVR
jgi:phage shock protein PspC (stress-responsive transcriptional regulator)